MSAAEYNSLNSAIDNHNLASSGESWFKKRATSIGNFAGDVGEAISKGAPAAVASGVISLYNGAAYIGKNFFGADIEEVKTLDVLSAYDSDLGRYYAENQTGVDLGGFIIGGIVPGVAGIKALRLAQSGRHSEGIGAATNLMRSKQAEFAAEATKAIEAGTPFSMISGNALKTIGYGAGAQALDAAAFEIAVAATMFRNPTIDATSLKNVSENILIGTLLGGGLGGVIEGATLAFGLKKTLRKVNEADLPFRNFGEIGDGASPDLKIIAYKKAMLEMPKVEAEVGTATYIRQTNIREESQTQLGLLVAKEFNVLAGGDNALSSQFLAGFLTTKTTQEAANMMLDVKKLTRIGAPDARSASETFTFNMGASSDEFIKAAFSKDFTKILKPGGINKNETGFVIVGDVSNLRASGAKIVNRETPRGIEAYEDSVAAFKDGVDIWRNPNGTIGINPKSKIIKVDLQARKQNNLIVDFEKGGAIVERATAGLADLATTKEPLKVVGNIVAAGSRFHTQIDVADMTWTPFKGTVEETQARYLWAHETKKSIDKYTIGEYDLPLLEKAARDGASEITIRRADGRVISAPTGQRLHEYIIKKKLELAEDTKGFPLEEVEYRLNATDKFILEQDTNGVVKYASAEEITRPRFASVDYDQGTSAAKTYDTFRAEGEVHFQRRVQLIQEIHEQNFAHFLHDFGSGLLAAFPDSFKTAAKGPLGENAGAGPLTFTNGDYGSWVGKAQFIGSLTARLTTSMQTESTRILNAAAQKLLATPMLGAEFDIVNNRLRQFDDSMVWHPIAMGAGGERYLIAKKDLEFAIEGKRVDNIPVSKAVAEMFEAHRVINGKRSPHIAAMRNDAGLSDRYDPSVIYPIPVDTRNYRHFVIVRALDGGIEGPKQSIIAARDEEKLRELISRVDRSTHQVINKDGSKLYHQAMGDFDAKLGFDDVLIDSELKRKGVASEFIPSADGKQAVDEFLSWHLREDEKLARSMVAHKYSQDFEELRRIGEQTSGVSTSMYGTINAYLRDTVKNNYTDIIKTSLNISRISEFQRWSDFNNLVRGYVEAPVNKLIDLFSKTQAPTQAFVDSVNKIGRETGMGAVYKDIADAMIANNAIAPKPWMPKIIAQTHAVMAGAILQLDFFNAINNVIGTPILLSAEMSSLRKAIAAGDSSTAGKLAALTNTEVPGQGFSIPSTSKLMHIATQNMAKAMGGETIHLDRYNRIGSVMDTITQQRELFKDLTHDFGTLTEAQATSKLGKAWEKSKALTDSAYEKGRKITGNTLSEQATRFITSDVMRQVTDLAVEGGLMSVKEADEYISIFVNRVQGNYIASQRPIAFQGVVGQAISLFQTYQFNLMQQLFRYVGDGDKKAVALLLGLQGSIYGLQGMPAFNFLNTHIVGNAAGNTEHKDLYNAAYSTAGKTMGDWLLYGLGSNALSVIDPSMKVNIYSRGDINPRQLTVLPTTLADIPAISATTRFVANLYDVSKKLIKGADLWPTLSQGLEHNALSRPLTGIAQVMQGYTTTSQGSLLSNSQDFYRIATLSRVLGGKPFDEAIALDALYRINAYRAKDLNQIRGLGEVIKTTLVAGGNPSQEQIHEFQASYVKAGGKQESFNRYMTGLMTSANQSQVNKLAQNINSPFSQQMQTIMGGVPLRDFMNTPATD